MSIHLLYKNPVTGAAPVGALSDELPPAAGELDGAELEDAELEDGHELQDAELEDGPELEDAKLEVGASRAQARSSSGQSAAKVALPLKRAMVFVAAAPFSPSHS